MLFILLSVVGVVLWFSAALAAGVQPKTPCDGSIARLEDTYRADATFKFMLDQAFKNMHQVPDGYADAKDFVGGTALIGRRHRKKQPCCTTC
ncbi:MAG: hypothetical protein ABIL58_18135 [Pseudomonadota bacterium]